ncbi:dehydrogenase reductase Sdr family member 4, putative [Bodo saltans]|uniref:Dehydrogenase reductase Sdr family member 4, putative n=1 Tax=Bodo saltans TaxID=75058 RepID=A0A0S4JMY5_BODSA|nr:dehydrogenase reductase Sdr family member 4, putative [Bodo saltans]|eukprot:CUG89877.1 dehydrogenase reductase Sdr family member 4, putative [Bodo saltans]
MKRFSGKVCVVTGSTDGIGYAIAERFAKEGGKVFVSSRKESNVSAAIKNLQQHAESPAHIAGCVCHVNKADHRKALLESVKAAHGSIDVLVLNAASSTFFGPVLDTPAKALDHMVDTNIKSTFLLAQESVPFLTQPSTFAAGGFSTNLLLVASIAGYAPSSPIGVYGITKSAMLGMTKAFAVDLAPKGIRVNAVAPGVIRTSFSSLLVDAFDAKAQAKSEGKVFAPEVDSPLASVPESLSSCLMNRVGEVSEVAATAAFLCSSDASYVTGEVMVISGGINARL